MWQARILGQHCQERRRFVNFIFLRKLRVPSEAKELVDLQAGEAPLMGSTAATVSQGTTCKAGLVARVSTTTSIASVSLPVAPSVPGRTSAPRSPFLGRGLSSRNASNLVPVRLVVLDKPLGKCEAIGLEAGQRAALHGAVRNDTSNGVQIADTAPEHQVRHRSNPAVQPQEALQDLEDFRRLWPQGSAVQGKFREILAEREGAAGLTPWLKSAYWQKRRGRDWGQFGHEQGVVNGAGDAMTRGDEAIRLALERRSQSLGGHQREEGEKAIPFVNEFKKPGEAGKAPERWDPKEFDFWENCKKAAQARKAAIEALPDKLEGAQGFAFWDDRKTSAQAAKALNKGVSEEEPLEVGLSEAYMKDIRNGRRAEWVDPEDPVLLARVEALDLEGRALRSAEKQRYLELRDKQHKRELMALDAAVKRFNEDETKKRQRGLGASTRAPIVSDLFVPLRREIEREKVAILNGERSMDRQHYGPYILLLEADKLAALTIQCVLNGLFAPENGRHGENNQRQRLAEKGWVKMTSVIMALGQAVETEANLARMVNQQKLQRLKERNDKRAAKAAALAKATVGEAVVEEVPTDPGFSHVSEADSEGLSRAFLKLVKPSFDGDGLSANGERSVASEGSGSDQKLGPAEGMATVEGSGAEERVGSEGKSGSDGGAAVLSEGEGSTGDSENGAKKGKGKGKKGVKEPKEPSSRERARAGVEAVMQTFFPDIDSLQLTHQGYRLPPTKQLRASGRKKINLHARQAIEGHADWGNDVHAKLGAVLIQIFLKATEVPPQVLESRPRSRNTTVKLARQIQNNEIPGVDATDAPELFENARRLTDQGFPLRGADAAETLAEGPSQLPDTATNLADPASSTTANEVPLEDSSHVSETATRLDDTAGGAGAATSSAQGRTAQETAIEETMREVSARQAQDEERRRLSSEAGTSEGEAAGGKGKKKRRGKHARKAPSAETPLVTDAAVSGAVGGTERLQDETETPPEGVAGLVSGRNGLTDVLVAPITAVAAVQSRLIETIAVQTKLIEIIESRLGPGPVPTAEEPIPTDTAADDAERAARVEEAVAKYGMEWGHLSVPKKGKPNLVPAFRHTLRILRSHRGGLAHRCGVLEVHPAVLEMLSRESALLADRFPRHLPMLVAPRPWVSHNRGGQLLLRTLIMRSRGSIAQIEQLRKACKTVPGEVRPAMQPVFDALNALGKVPWKINAPVADVFERLWTMSEEGDGLAGLPARKLVELPAKPGVDTSDKNTWRDYKRAVQKARQINSDHVSQGADVELKLATMRQLRNEERFFFPHSLDFRGRAYPLHPYLNHLGSDVCRGTLMFADGRRLGERGLRWLKIHLANLVGNSVDKLSFDEREQYCDDNMDEIMDSADRPLEGRRWWMSAEDPFQALAACIEIAAAVRSGDPPSYKCALPVHQDGSCNGLQHYAALGRDVAGAQHVNMMSMDRPADVYTGIAEKVKELVDEGAAQGSDVALALRGHVDRKLVKQTVMTSVYGVTFVGARAQIKSRLKEKGVTDDEALLFLLSTYATKVTLTSLGELFTSARAIMTWLSKCAQIIAGRPPAGNDAPVTWTTPLGLPVVQPYRKRSKKVVLTVLQSVYLDEEKADDKVHPGRQKSAFAPNYVHSLDATHMMMTASACERAGLMFAGVHDSYWTHAGDVEQMNGILREKFIELHSAPLLENLLAEFRAMYPDLNFPEVPKRGEFDVRSVRDAPYFFD